MVEGMMERDSLDSEVALREDITRLREQMDHVRRSLGALEEEVRRREGEFIAIRSAHLLRDGVNDD